LRELAERPGEEEKLEAALRTEVEEELGRLEEVERELDKEFPGGSEIVSRGGSAAADPCPTTGGVQEGARRPWWRRAFGG
jgi:hypothetical protein